MTKFQLEKVHRSMSDSEYLVEVNGLGKKFCRKLKRSLWYGVKDIGAELVGSKRSNAKLRKDEFWALKDLNFNIKKGELVGLIGPNGAGKTTLLKVLTGLIKPDEGSVTIRGKIQALIALGAGFNPILTGRENIYINGAILGFSKSELDGMLDEILEFSEMGEFIDMPVQSYSSGMHVRLGFAVAVNLRPDILIVDEVLAVGDASFRRKARNKMMDLLHSGISVLFVSHHMGMISSLTSRCLYLQRGRMIASGPSDDVVTQYMQDSLNRARQHLPTDVSDLMTSAYYTMPEEFQAKKVQLLNNDGNECGEFHSHDKIKIVIAVEFLKEMEGVTFALSILEGTDGIVISSSRFTIETRACKGLVTITCEVNESRLREGSYNLGFYALDFKGGTLYKSNNVKSFAILADASIMGNADRNHGLITMAADWKVL
jgi:homopolymeric O-antigen transport system ATP-binding protein